MEKNKKMLIICGIVVILLILIISLVLGRNTSQDKQNQGSSVEKSVANMSQAFEITNIEQSNLEITKTKNKKIASKYAIGANIYELNGKADFMDISGDMIYVRESYSNLNIFQKSYRINKYKDINSQISQYMTEFERMCTSYLGVEMDEELDGTLYGESKQNTTIPVEESIYYEERLYSKTYTVKNEQDKTEESYDINFYKNGENLVCEFVYIIK